MAEARPQILRTRERAPAPRVEDADVFSQNCHARLSGQQKRSPFSARICYSLCGSAEGFAPMARQLAAEFSMSTFGILFKAYWELAQRLDCDSGEPFQEDYPALRDSLADLFRALPSGTGILTLSELDFVIGEFTNAIDPSIEEPSEIESEFSRLLEPKPYNFRVPIARLRQFEVNDIEIGGRIKLGLDTDESNGKVLCVLKG